MTLGRSAKSTQAAADIQKEKQRELAREAKQLRQLVQGECLESLVLERLELPAQVVEFNQFEELSKLYEIEQPFVARTQVELLFDVYDGRRLKPGLFESLEEEEEDEEEEEEDHEDDHQVGEDNHEQDEEDEEEQVREEQQEQREQEGKDVAYEANGQKQSAAAVAARGQTGGTGNYCQLTIKNSLSSSYSSAAAAARRRSSFAASSKLTDQKGAGRAGSHKANRGLSWCKSLFARKHAQVPRPTRASPFKCCLRPSDTNQELGLLSMSPSELQVAPTPLGPATVGLSNSLVGRAQVALMEPTATSQANQVLSSQIGAEDEDEIKCEALQILASSLAGTAANSRPVSQSMSHLGGSSLSAAFAMESAQLESTGGCVSVCLLDKRRLLGKSACHHNHHKSNTGGGIGGGGNTTRGGGGGGGGGSGSGGSGKTMSSSATKWLNARQPARLNLSHRKGREWARASARLVRIRCKLRNSGVHTLIRALDTKVVAKTGTPSRKLLLQELNRTGRKVSHKFWSELAHDNLLTKHHDESPNSNWPNESKNCEYLTRQEQVEKLIELVKGSLNQLIDAQLLLRNKLAGLDQQLGSCALVAQVRSAEYENLLRNNFNLLKIWQNLEETSTSGLVCFVCEPIRANLADLFWFNRERLDWPPAQVFEGAQLNSNTRPSNGGANSSSSTRCQLLISPLVCLDAGQVKRGLLQILEALNYLHGICKLIHRNVTPGNILVCQDDNWKLSGLEFAVRFESTTISESASMMAHEFGQMRYTGVCGPATTSSNGAGANANAAATSQSSGCGAGFAGAAASGPGSTFQLRRQRTLHETKCQEIVRQGHKGSESAGCALLQPDLDYLAPEIWRHSKCSHKSDLFSFGLVLGQVYDLCRHKPPISCRLVAANYDTQLKKLEERRKEQLCLLVPSEMRFVLAEMLNTEPNLRPSANNVLQLLKRPVELCKTNEDSLRHLKSSLDYLDNRVNQPARTLGMQHQSLSGQTGGGYTTGAHYNNQQQHDSSTVGLVTFNSTMEKQILSASGSNSSAGTVGMNKRARGRTAGYFKRVTSKAANRESAKRQTKSLRLLNYFVRAVDAMASLGLPAGERDRLAPSAGPTGRDILLGAHNLDGGQQQQQHQQQHHHQYAQRIRRGSFCSQRLVCEQTLEILRQVLRSSGTARQAGLGPGEPNLESQQQQQPQGAAPCPGDSRFLLLIVVLHRRLLEQVAGLRAELPPVCRLIAPAGLANSSGANQPLDKSLASANHRALADLEERLYLVVSRHSMGRLSEALADPLLKLEEFLLVFELVNDLVGFVGQKCKQNYSQRGKQFLNELTPVTGCPSLSSSEDDSDDNDQEPSVLTISQQQRSFGGSTLALAMQSNSQGSPGSAPGATTNHQIKRYSQQERYATSYEPTNEFYNQQQQQQHQIMTSSSNNINLRNNNNNNSRANSRNNSQTNLNINNHPGNRQSQISLGQVQQYQLPTTINIVAPSPMGSVRDVSRLSSHADSPVDTRLFSAPSPAYSSNSNSNPNSNQRAPNSPIKRHSHQDILANMQQQQQQLQHNSLIDKTSQMSLTSGVGRRSIANCLTGTNSSLIQQQQQQQQQQRRREQLEQQNNCDFKQGDESPAGVPAGDDKSRSELIDELLKTINDDSFNEFIDFNNKISAAGGSGGGGGGGGTCGSSLSQPDELRITGAVSGNLTTGSAMELANGARSKSAIGDHCGGYSTSASPTGGGGGGGGHTRRQSCSPASRGTSSPAPPRTLNLNSMVGGPVGSGAANFTTQRMARGSICAGGAGPQAAGSTFDNVIRRMSTNFVQNFNKMSATTGVAGTGQDQTGNYCQQQQQQQQSIQYPELNVQQASLSNSASQLRRETSSGYVQSANNSLYVDQQIPARRHSDNTINVPRIQVALSSPSSSNSRTNLNQRASVSASKLANKWKLTAKTNQREASDKLSPNLGGALTYIRRHSSGNAQAGEKADTTKSHHTNDASTSGPGQSNGGLGAQLLNASPFKTKSSSNLGIDFLMSNRSMKRRYSAASMLGHQTQRKAEDLIDAGMKSVQNMFS